VIEQYMSQVREQEYVQMPDRSLFSEANATALLDAVEHYYTDSLPDVRLKAYYFTYKAVKSSADSTLRSRAVKSLVNALQDSNSGNVGSVAVWLTQFSKRDFNSQAKDSLVSALKRVPFYRDEILKLAGFVGLTDQIDFIKGNLIGGLYRTGKEKWAAYLALARMGDDEATAYCLGMVKQQGINDDVVYELVPDLIYTRQKKAVDYVIEILQDTEENCTSGNPEFGGRIMCGYRVMEYLAPVIVDFPLATDDYGDLMTDDYEAALQQLRVWFNTHQEGYTFVQGIY